MLGRGGKNTRGTEVSRDGDKYHRDGRLETFEERQPEEEREVKKYKKPRESREERKRRRKYLKPKEDVDIFMDPNQQKELRE